MASSSGRVDCGTVRRPRDGSVGCHGCRRQFSSRRRVWAVLVSMATTVAILLLLASGGGGGRFDDIHGDNHHGNGEVATTTKQRAFVHALSSPLGGGSRRTTAFGGGKNNRGGIPVVDGWRVLSDGKLTGTVIGHPIIPDGDIITTSPLSNPDFASKQGAVVTTLSGSKYKLLSPQPGYLKRAAAKAAAAANTAAKSSSSSSMYGGGASTSGPRRTKAVVGNIDQRVAESARRVGRVSTAPDAKKKKNKKKGGAAGLVVSFHKMLRGRLRFWFVSGCVCDYVALCRGVCVSRFFAPPTVSSDYI